MKNQAIGIVMPLGSQQGGAEALLQHLLHHGSERYQYLCAFLQDGPVIQQARDLGYDVTVIPITHLREVSNYLETVIALYRWMTEKKLSKVVSWMMKAHLYVAPAAVIAGIEALWFQHGGTNKGRMDRLVTLLPASRILCCSKATQKAQESMFPGRPAVVCYPGVYFPPGDLLSVQEARRHLNLPLGATIIGMVARWERWKGPHIFIQAARLVSMDHPEAVFFIAGGPHPRDLAYADEVRELAAQSGLGERLILAGQRPPVEIPFWQASADIIVHPVTGIEPFGMAVAEAMGMRKLVLAANVGGPSEIIQDGVNGILVPEATAANFASAIVRMLDNPELVKSLSSAAYLRGRSFSIEAFANRFEDHLSQSAE